MFKVRITVLGALGDEKKYPCHFHHKPGDEIVFDGETMQGKLCPVTWTLVMPHVEAFYNAGPRYHISDYYAPFWYCPTSIKDASMTVYDGRGYKNVLKKIVEPKYTLGGLKPEHAFQWPPHGERTVASDVIVTCKDMRTAMMFKIEAFDLSDAGYSVPFYRRQMCILARVLPKNGIAVEDILGLFSKQEQLKIYPALSPQVMPPLVEELELLKYMDIRKGKAFVTAKGKKKLEAFKKALSAVEKKALKL
jgi:uncharacterized repeat protein (TIGR04076 family)